VGCSCERSVGRWVGEWCLVSKGGRIPSVLFFSSVYLVVSLPRFRGVGLEVVSMDIVGFVFVA